MIVARLLRLCGGNSLYVIIRLGQVHGCLLVPFWDAWSLCIDTGRAIRMTTYEVKVEADSLLIDHRSHVRAMSVAKFRHRIEMYKAKSCNIVRSNPSLYSKKNCYYIFS